ncbi:Spermatogenesis-associated 31 subfamily D, member 1D [Apodemus speciosus]|uniref:Spermatogenesis-associated 31 subfamily D, member 1D n=1 Tax=Apodemus speciosus TaxID=105296 RepID=A0ABQ0FG92_APOSI
MRPRVPISPPTKPVKTKQKKEYWVPTDPVQGRQFHPQAPLSKAPSPRFHNQGAAFVGQKRCVAEKARQLQKCEALQPRLSASHRESELRQNLLLSRAGKVPRGTPPFAVGTMLADMSRLCEQKILSQNFSGKGFVLQK